MQNTDHKNKLITFLKVELEYYKTEDFLKKLYPPPKQNTRKDKHIIRDYHIFIDYMKQGFNRQRKHLAKKYHLDTEQIKRIAIKRKWIKNAGKWEQIVINTFIKWSQLPHFNDKIRYMWNQYPYEKNYPYFCFLCYLYLNLEKQYSQPQCAEVMINGGLKIVSQTLNQHSGKFSWVKRLNSYKSFCRAESTNFTSAVTYTVAQSTGVPTYEVNNWIEDDIVEFQKALQVFSKYCNHLTRKHTHGA